MSGEQTGLPQRRGAARPGRGRVVPTATYRLQIEPRFTFACAAQEADYLAALGISHVYLSPVLQPAPGSTHGYDVVDHTRLNEEAGGLPAFEAMVDRLRSHGVRVVVDVVPNHMTTPTPAHLNRPWWLLLREGRESSTARWFDVDWDAEDGRVLLPVLGSRLGDALAAGEVSVEAGGGPDGTDSVLRYHDHVFPVRPGTEALALPELVAAQSYRLCHWREGGARLNYRRFFDVSTLAAVRVEDPEVFEATHRLLVDLVAQGSIDGLRIDHPDGLADPGGYLARLADATGDAWVVAEKILEGHEGLPEDWRCAGTTGYDTLRYVGGVFVAPSGEGPLTDVWVEFSGDARDVGEHVVAAKEQVVAQVQAAEVNRLVRLAVRILPDLDGGELRSVLEALLVSMDRYRAYIGPGEPASEGARAVIGAACARASSRLGPDGRGVLDTLRGLVLGEACGTDRHAADEFVVRFQQTCGPVMAKGIEDTAFYRYARLTALNEVGGDPSRVGIAPAELHQFAQRQLATWPATMTTLSTHDTKRSEDVRARLAVLAELPHEWAAWVRRARDLAAAHRSERLDGATEYLLWQSVVGAWPISSERLQSYATKAIREAKARTSWTDPDEGYEQAVAGFVDGITTDPGLVGHISTWVDRASEAARVATLGQKLLQLVLPGVPDVYQGTELVDLSLVDPDNRRPVDYAVRRARLARLESGEAPEDLADEKLLLTVRALRLRREHAEWFVGTDAHYAPVPTTTDHALAVGRGRAGDLRVVAVATRLPEALWSAGGWAEQTLTLPAGGSWREVLTGSPVVADSAGRVRLAELLGSLPVALLVRDESD